MTPDAAFEAAADAIVDGDETALKALLTRYPELVRARSSRHGATLLHYVSANGVEDERQRTPANVETIARLLLDAGAAPDATAHFYGGPAATLGLLVSSVHPHKAGLQARLANQLLDAGARGEGAILTALAHGYGDTAEDLAGRLPVESLPAAAGLGRTDIFDRLLPGATSQARHQAVAVAAQHGRIDILERLIAAGEDLNRFNPEGFHSHSTPLHQAVAQGRLDTVRWLVGHGARTDIADTLHGGTPLGWARHEGHTAVASYLESL